MLKLRNRALTAVVLVALATAATAMVVDAAPRSKTRTRTTTPPRPTTGPYAGEPDATTGAPQPPKVEKTSMRPGGGTEDGVLSTWQSRFWLWLKQTQRLR
jgi:hypothetical protein